ncbi:Ankyrin repeat-containing protein [Nymphaea thermarum]|nr:Ankyrin repeat-containing protein [Nymphaea thermarum]
MTPAKSKAGYAPNKACASQAIHQTGSVQLASLAPARAKQQTGKGSCIAWGEGQCWAARACSRTLASRIGGDGAFEWPAETEDAGGDSVFKGRQRRRRPLAEREETARPSERELEEVETELVETERAGGDGADGECWWRRSRRAGENRRAERIVEPLLVEQRPNEERERDGWTGCGQLVRRSPVGSWFAGRRWRRSWFAGGQLVRRSQVETELSISEKLVKVLPFLGFGFFGYNAHLEVNTNREPLESSFSVAIFATFVVSVGSVMRAQSLTEKRRGASLPLLVALFLVLAAGLLLRAWGWAFLPLLVVPFLVIAAGFLLRAWVVLPPTFGCVLLLAFLLPTCPFLRLHPLEEPAVMMGVSGVPSGGSAAQGCLILPLISPMFARLADLCAKGDLSELKRLANADAGILNCVCPSSCRTLLHIAAEAGQQEIARYLLKMQPELAEKTCGDLRLTPLHLAAMNGSTKVIFALLDQKISAFKQITSARQNILHLMATSGQCEAFIRTFLKYGLRELVKDTDEEGSTVLHLCVRKRSTELMKFILEEKVVPVNTLNKVEKTALDLAIEEHGHPTSAQMIADLRKAKCITATELAKLGSPGHEAPDDLLRGVLNTIVVAAVLIATLAFSTLLNPPGGVYQEGPQAGRAILSTHPLFPAFFAFNVFALLSSLVIVVAQSSSVAFTRDQLNYRWVVLKTLLTASTVCMLMDCLIAAWMTILFRK